MLAYLKRGEAHQRRGDTPETLTAALRDLRTGRRARSGRDPDSRKAGRRKHGAPSLRERRENYEAYIRIDDHSARLFYKLALASRGDGRLTRAIVALQQAVTLNPSFHEAYYVLGLCRKDRGELADARARSSAPSPSPLRSCPLAKSSQICIGSSSARATKSSSSTRSMPSIRPSPSA
jgi:tetratricopeptide (TPR) repeat protein